MKFLCSSLALLSLTWFYKARCGSMMSPQIKFFEIEMFFETKNVLQ